MVKCGMDQFGNSLWFHLHIWQGGNPNTIINHKH
jgi:hypothetical protein